MSCKTCSWSGPEIDLIEVEVDPEPREGFFLAAFPLALRRISLRCPVCGTQLGSARKPFGLNSGTDME
ncbi:MAG TPA: hypothetical protein VMB46_04680 [Methanomassiliicoccales archaeon]|nr:hypothetical protein [Methanomassiliicoccales archaeon]